jgi:hypothetical protein
MIAQLEFFQKQLAELDAHIEKVFSRLEHPIKTIPGIGSMTGPLLGDLRRFAGRRPLQAWPMPARSPAFAEWQWSGKSK